MYEQQLRCAVRAAETAGALLRTAFHAGENDVDRGAEREILAILLGVFPEYGYRGEELGPVAEPRDADGHLWLVDPDDGTAAFEKGFRGASVSIALLREGRPVLGVVYAYCAPDDRGDWFTWAEGCGPLRRNGVVCVRGAVPETVLVSHVADRNAEANARLCGPLRYRAVPSIAYRLALVAAGEAQVATSLKGPNGWDYAGGHALLLGAGMDLYDSQGAVIRYDRTGDSRCPGDLFGGSLEFVAELRQRDWSAVMRNRPEESALCWPQRGCSVSDAGLLARAQGCVLGQLAGDSLGGLVEFRDAESIRREHPDGVSLLLDGGTWNTIAGQPTDDSEMALMLARSIVRMSGYDGEDARRAYVSWRESGPFDIGGATSAALSGTPSSDTQANGALMRVSPLGLLGDVDAARRDASITHPHPVCQDANAVFVAALRHAIQTGSGAEDVYRHALGQAETEPVRTRLRLAASERPADYLHRQGWVLTALQNAFWQLLHAESFVEGVVDTVMCGGDTDTNGAIAGALLGAVYGREAVPLQWRDRVLSCRPISGLAGVHRPRPDCFWPVDALWLAERLVAVGGPNKENC